MKIFQDMVCWSREKSNRIILEKQVSSLQPENYANKMAAAYRLMKGRIEEKYAASDRQKEYYGL